MKMNKFRNELKSYKEWYEKEADQSLVTIASLIRWMEGSKVITKEEADFLISLIKYK